MPMKVISGTANVPLARRIAEHLDVPLADVVITRFPDQETFIKISENIRGHDVFLIQPTSPPANEHLMELLIMIDAIKRASALRIGMGLTRHGGAWRTGSRLPRCRTWSGTHGKPGAITGSPPPGRHPCRTRRGAF